MTAVRIEYVHTGMTRQVRDTYTADLEWLPEGGGHISVDVVDPQGEVGHICVFRDTEGRVCARKGTPDPRNLYNKLKRNLRLKTIRVAVKDTPAETAETLVSTVLHDVENEHRRLGVDVIREGGGRGLNIAVDTLGVKDAVDNSTCGPILLEIQDGMPRLVVWADINASDPTHIIDLSGARLAVRKGSGEE